MIIVPESMIIVPEPMIIYPESMIVFPESMIVYPESMIIYPESMIVFPEPMIVYPESMIIYPESMIVYPEAKVVYPEAKVVNPEVKDVYPEVMVDFLRYFVLIFIYIQICSFDNIVLRKDENGGRDKEIWRIDSRKDAKTQREWNADDADFYYPNTPDTLCTEQVRVRDRLDMILRKSIKR